MSPDEAWDELNAALEHYAPPCSDLPLFTADSRTDEQRASCASICARCRITAECHGCATTTKADFGFWAGVDRAGRGRGRLRKSTTDAGAVSTAPITQKEETS